MAAGLNFYAEVPGPHDISLRSKRQIKLFIQSRLRCWRAAASGPLSCLGRQGCGGLHYPTRPTCLFCLDFFMVPCWRLCVTLSDFCCFLCFFVPGYPIDVVGVFATCGPEDANLFSIRGHFDLPSQGIAFFPILPLFRHLWATHVLYLSLVLCQPCEHVNLVSPLRYFRLERLDAARPPSCNVSQRARAATWWCKTSAFRPTGPTSWEASVLSSCDNLHRCESKADRIRGLEILRLSLVFFCSRP